MGGDQSMPVVRLVHDACVPPDPLLSGIEDAYQKRRERKRREEDGRAWTAAEVQGRSVEARLIDGARHDGRARSYL